MAKPTIVIVRSLKRKTISLEILPDQIVRLTIPYLFPKSKINKILIEKDEWIQEHLNKISLRSLPKEKETFLYLGKEYPVTIRLNQKNIIEFDNGFFLGTQNTKYTKTYLTSWYKQQARKVIKERIDYYAQKAGLRYKSFSLMEATTRWGSCSIDKNLNFNWKLIMAPLSVIDYVVTHELAHLVELNHSKAFWETVRKMYPLYREHRTWLKRYGHSLTI